MIKKEEENIDIILSEWREYTENVLMPVVAATGERLEGNMYCMCGKNTYDEKFLEKQRNLIAIAKSISDKAVAPGPFALEIGFNSGFSAALLLLSAPKMMLTCVDIGEHSYTRPCFEKLRERFPDRVTLIIGDSRMVLPQLKRNNERTSTTYHPTMYDLIHIDGCHLPEVATHDIYNCSLLCSPGAIMVMDDTDADFLMRLWKAETTKQAIITIPYIETKIPGFKKTIFHDVRQRPHLAFYTVFCGQEAHIADAVLRPPGGGRFPSYYFSNNQQTLKRATNAGWIAVDVSTECPQWEDEVISASQAKPFKATPHNRKELNTYDFTIYIDSKRLVDIHGAGAALEKLTTTGKALLLKVHPSRDTGVHIEFQRAMTLERYKSQQNKIVTYINKMVAQKEISNDQPNVWTTMVARDMRHKKCKEIGEEWMRDIQQCGIECQISAFFLQQRYKEDIIIDHTEDTKVVFDVTT